MSIAQPARLINSFAFLVMMGLSASVCSHEHGASAGEPQPAPTGATSGRAATPLAWTEQPVLLVAGRPEGLVTPLAAKGLESDQLTIFSPDPKHLPVALAKEGGRWMAKPLTPGIGGYHWVSARSEQPQEIRSAASAVMFPGKGPSPASLLADYRKGLDIRPVRIPERGGFREGSDWEFLIRFDGLPLTEAVLSFETENGTKKQLKANANGIAYVTFPRDFDQSLIDKDAGAARSRKNFVIAASIDREGVRHVSAFNHFYYPDLMRERSLAWGVGFTLLGMACATPLLRRKEKDNA